MARNRSEQSPSGDPMVDDYLRAWLRWYRARGRRRLDLRSVRDIKLDLLTHEQASLVGRIARDGDMLLYEGAVRLYGQEAEFQDAS